MTGRKGSERCLRPGRFRVSDVSGVLGWGLLGVFAILFYQLCVIPGLLEYSVYGFALFAAGAALLVLLFPPADRRSHLTFLLAALFAYEALSSIRLWSIPAQAAGAVFILAVIAATARVYARLHRARLAAFALAALLVFALAPGEQIRVANHFALLEESPNLYGGEVFTYFPLRVDDFTDDGRVQILSWGNREELLAERDELGDDTPVREHPHILAPERAHPYAFTWEGDGLIRTPSDELPGPVIDAAAHALTAHYPAFPYYATGPDGELEPRLSPFELTDSALHFARAPALAAGLALAAAAERLDAYDGAADRADFPDAGFRDVRLTGERLEFTWQGEQLQLATGAMQIIGPVRLEGGPGLALLGSSLQIVTVGQDAGGPRPTVTHELTAEDFSEVGLVDPLIADVDGDGRDELLLSSSHSPSRILKPESGGGFRLLWAAAPDDLSFRFEDVRIGPDGGVQIIAQRRSLVRDDPLRYLTGYRYVDGILQTHWRSMFNMVDVHARDLTRDGATEIIGLRYGAHRFWVLRPHGIPATLLLWVGAGLFAAYLLLARLRGLSPMRRRPWYAAVAGVLVVAVLTLVFAARLNTYPSAGSVPEAETEESEGETPAAARSLEELLPRALAAGREEERFWYTGWIASFVGKRQVNSMYNGTVELPRGYVSNVRIAANPLRILRWDGDVFLEERETWFEREAMPAEVELLADFDRLLPAAEAFRPVGAGSVMGMPCRRYEAEFDLVEWMQLMGEGGVDGPVPPDIPAFLLERGSVEVGLWIGENEPLLHQFRAVLRLPLPGAGESKQEVMFQFYRYGDPTIEPVDVQKIRGYLRRQRDRVD